MDWQIQGLGGNGDAAMGMEMFMLVAAIVILLQLRTRRVRPRSIWIMPVFMSLVTVAIIAFEYSGPGTLLFSAAGLVVGGAIGAIIGSHMEVKANERGEIVFKGSLVAVTIWITVLGLKIFGKGLLGDTGLISLNDLTAALLAVTMGAIIARRTFIALKYLRLKKQNTEALESTVNSVH
jgi:membrane protein CcdC involved in cytochrome C biogenesis